MLGPLSRLFSKNQSAAFLREAAGVVEATNRITLELAALRDGAWMGQIYYFLGLSVGVVTSIGAYLYDPTHVESGEEALRDQEAAFRVFYDYLRPVDKRAAYAADVTDATNNELGFDYLRDNTAYDASQIVQRGH